MSRNLLATAPITSLTGDEFVYVVQNGADGRATVNQIVAQAQVSGARALVVSVRNQSGGTMTAGTVVYINGATGNLSTIAKAIATSDATSAQTLGLVQTDIANNGTGLVVVRGILSNLNTSGLTEGQQLYLSPTTAGTYTTTKQYAPNHLVYIGIVTRAHPTLGSIEVAVQNGFEMDELHNVSAQSPADGDILRYNTESALWEKSALGTLATQSGTFSGTSSGTNTGDQTATTVSNTPAGGIAATTVQAAINELDTEKAPLASPALTGNPTAPTPTVTDDDTSIATTAFVQDVQQAEWTQPTAIAITAAGNSNVAAVSAQNRYLTQRVNVTAFTGTATVTLQNTSALAGDKRRFIVSMPAGFANLIELRNLTSGGTLLATVPMDGALARTWLGYSTFDGTNWGAVSFSPMSVDEFVMARTAFRTDYANSDGATPNRASGIYGPFDSVNNPREWIAGAASLTIAAVVTVPTSNPSSTIVIYQAGPNSTSAIPSVNSMQIAINNGGGLEVYCFGAAGYSDRRGFGLTSNFITAYGGKTVFMSVIFTAGATAPVIKVNGTTLTLSAGETVGSFPSWLDATMTPTYRRIGGDWPSGPAPIVTPILGQTSAADDAFYMQTGKWPAWVVAGGSMVNVLSSISRNGDFSAGVTDWITFGSATATVNASKLDVVVTNGGARLGFSGNPYNVSLNGRGVLIKVTLSNVSGGTVGCYNASGGGFFQTFATGLTNGTYYLTLAPLNSSSSNPIDIAFGGGGVSFTIDDFVPVLVGALSIPSYQPINVIDDVSGIGGNQGRLVGVTAVTDKKEYTVLAVVDTSSTGNKQLMGGAVFPNGANVSHDSIETVTTGAPTLSIGDGTTATKHTASTALSAGRTRIAITSPFPTAAANTGIYANVTVAGGAAEKIIIKGHLLN